MGQMSWIHGMVADGTYEGFKKTYIKCVLTNQDSFDWGSMNVAKSYGKSVVRYVDKVLSKEYDEYIDRESELQQASIEA